jgi:hypothetical protein
MLGNAGDRERECVGLWVCEEREVFSVQGSDWEAGARGEWIESVWRKRDQNN